MTTDRNVRVAARSSAPVPAPCAVEPPAASPLSSAAPAVLSIAEEA